MPSTGKNTPTSTSTRSKTGATSIKHTPGSNQASFDLKDNNIFLWRRALLVRYFQILGNNNQTKVQWNDFDQKSKPLEIPDEKHPFTNKIPKNDLFRSVVSVTLIKQKLFVVTIYYTTKKAMVQGQGTSEWIQIEYKLINETINSIIEMKKKGKTIDVDKVFKEMKIKSELINIDLETEDEVHSPIQDLDNSHSSNTSVQIEDTFVKRPYNAEPENNNDKNNSTQTESKITCIESELSKIRDEQTRHKEEITKMKTTIHDLEIELVQKDVELQNMSKQYSILQSKVNKAENINDQQVEKIRNHIQDFEDKILRKLDEKMKEINRKSESFDKYVSTDIQPKVNKNAEKFTELEKQIQYEVKQKVDNLEQQVFVIRDELKNRKPEQETEENKNGSENPATKTNAESAKPSDKSADENKESKTNETENVASPKTGNVTYQNRHKNDYMQHDSYDVLIVGSSIIKDVNEKKMYKQKKVKVTVLNDKTVSGAIKYIKTCNVKAKNVVFQIGSNDIENKTVDNVIEEIEYLVQTTKRSFPDATITFGEILPRFYSDRYLAKCYNENRHVFNVQLYELCKFYNFHFVNYDFIDPKYFYDGIHIKGYGIAILVTSIKRVLSTILNVKFFEKPDSNVERNESSPYRLPRSNMSNVNRYQAYTPKSYVNNLSRGNHVHSGKSKFMNMLTLMLEEMKNSQW